MEKRMQRKFNDLCSTCNNAPDCAQLVNKKQPLLYCELFDDYIPSPAIIEINTDKSISKQLHEELGSNRKKKGSDKGLCQNCKNRNNCIYVNLEEGVWQCEEYI